MDFYNDIITQLINNKINTKDQLHKTKIKLCKKYQLTHIPQNSEILKHLPKTLPPDHPAHLLLQKKPMRTISGVAIVAVMTSPAACPHGKCMPCPGGPDHNTPQSYTGHEPAALRGDLNNFDPYLQTQNRIKQLAAIGHPTDKIDLIIMGGTFTARLHSYQQWFIKRCFDALNQTSSHTLEESQKHNETAPSRCIGLTIETRPDWFRLQHCDHSLALGTTRIELGVQTLNDSVLYFIKRGHTVTDTINATNIAKNAGLKICYHLMPGLPTTTPKDDIETIKTIFSDHRYQPDMLKIYPTLIMKDTELHTLWKQHKYSPLTTPEAIKLLSQIKQHIPEYVRIQRIQRDIPAQLIQSGVTKSNLRQWVQNEMKTHDTQCKCIRCREIGHKQTLNNNKTTIDPKTHCMQYTASDSTEHFISIEDKTKNILIGYLRLRDITTSHRSELSKHPCMIIRELKIMGKELPIGHHDLKATQHQGYGKSLINIAENICKEKHNKKHLFVLSGIGVKPYYRRLGFKNCGYYLHKKIT